MVKIIIVEDDENIREELKVLLNNNGYVAEYITDFTNAADYILKNMPEIVLLDVNLPNTNGLIICDKIRKYSQVPIIFVTSNRTSMDELNCIIRGGDDYIAKPYQVPILLARIASILKRTVGRENLKGEEDSSKIIYNNVTLDTAGAIISVGEKRIELTKNEVKIMYYLMKNKEKYVPRTDLIDYLWDNEVFIDDNTLSVNVTRIRNKLSEIGVSDFIETKRGMGYKV